MRICFYTVTEPVLPSWNERTKTLPAAFIVSEQSLQPFGVVEYVGEFQHLQINDLHFIIVHLSVHLSPC